MRRPLRKLVCCVLVATYALVGLFGESLFYLVEMGHVRPSTDGTSSLGYFHRHGDDQHWHYHGPTRSARHEAAPRDEAPSSDPRAAFRSPVPAHQAHGCVLLAVLAAMKVGAGGGTELPATVAASRPSIEPHGQIVLDVCRYGPGARGPPFSVPA